MIDVKGNLEGFHAHVLHSKTLTTLMVTVYIHVHRSVLLLVAIVLHDQRKTYLCEMIWEVNLNASLHGITALLCLPD